MTTINTCAKIRYITKLRRNCEKYTQQDFNAFEKDNYGYIICPTGDCSDIKEFPNYCSFGECCSFGERCIFFGLQIYCLFEFNKLVNLNGLFEYPIRIYVNTNVKEYYLSIGCRSFATLEEVLGFGKNSNYDLSDSGILESIICSSLK